VPGARFTTCEEHGRQAWKGDLFCSACGKIYVMPPFGLGPVPDVCSCKAQLLPPNKKTGKREWSGRIACHQCAIDQSR
jgi:hypothetical protein